MTGKSQPIRVLVIDEAFDLAQAFKTPQAFRAEILRTGRKALDVEDLARRALDEAAAERLKTLVQYPTPEALDEALRRRLSGQP